MYKINEDILMFAISEYLKEKDLSPYDAMLENSQLGSTAETWSAVLLRLMSFEKDTLKRNEILNADPIKNITLFNEQLIELHNRTFKVAFISGMLYQKWICENSTSYTDDKYLKQSEQFIDKYLTEY